MSTTRWISLSLLLLLGLGLAWVGYRSMLRNRPDYDWGRSQAALASGDAKTAAIHLQKMIQRFPKDPRGHRGLAAVLMKAAQIPETADGYAAYPDALKLLDEAGRLQAGDLELQKLLLAACLRAGRVQQAAVVAERVAKVEPRNVDVLYARARKSAEAGDSGAALAILDQLPESEQDAFRVLGLRAQMLQDRDPNDERLPEVLDAITTRASQLSGGQLAALSDSEFANMTRLLPASVANAADAATAHQRTEACLTVGERLAGTKSPRMKAIETMTAQVSGALTAKFPAHLLTADLMAARQPLTLRLEKLLGSGIAAEKLDLVVAKEAAQLAFDKGDYAGALKTLERALAQHKADKNAKPEEAQALHFLAAQCLLGLSRHREAKAHLEVLLEDKRTSGQGQLMLGLVAASEGRDQDALNHFTRAENLLAGHPLVTIELAQTLLTLGRWAEALPHLAALHELVKSENPQVQAWAAQQQLTDARIHLSEARAFLALKRWPDAASHLAALRGTDLEPRGVELEAEYVVGKGQAAEADKLLALGLQKFPRDNGLIGRRAAVLQQMGKPGEAQTLLATAAAQAPDDLGVQLMLASQYSQAGKHDEALRLLTALEQKHPDSVPVLVVKANALIQAGRADEAGALAERIRNLPASGALGSVVGVIAAMKANDPKRARESLQASGQVAENLQLRHMEGVVAAVTGDYRLAISALGESVRVTGLRDSAGPLLCTSVAQLAQKEGPAAAERALRPVVAASPEDSFVLVAQSDVLAMQGKFNESLKLLDRLEQIDKESPVAPYLKGAVLSRMNDAAAATKEVNRALTKDPRHVASLALAAQLYFTAKNYGAAIDHAQAVLNLLPGAWELAVLKSEAQWAAGRQNEALMTIQQLIERMPDLVEARRQLVNLQTRATQYAAALATCRQAREKFKDDGALAVQEIVLMHLAGQPDASAERAKQWVGVPADAAKALSVANGFVQLKQYALAKGWAEAALKVAKDKERPAAHQFLGSLALVENGVRPDRKLLAEARDHFAAVLQDVPNDVIAGNNLAWILAVDFGQAAEAVVVAERARGEAPAADLPLTFVDTMATVYRRANEFNKAAVLLEHVLAAHPDDAAMKFHLGMTLGQVNRASEAKQLLQESLRGTLSPAQVAEARQELQRIAAAEAAAAAAEAAAAKAAAAEAAAAAAAAAAKESATPATAAKPDRGD